MLYYRVAIQGSQPDTWRWKLGPLTSLHRVVGWVHLYRCMRKERIRVFLSPSPEQMQEMLSRANQRMSSTAITADQLWDRHRVSWIEVRRLEIELGAGGDQDLPYTWLPPSGSLILAWTKLRTKRVGLNFVP